MTSESEKRNELLSKKLVPGGLVEYQHGSVVSRTIINKPAGTVTVFAFDEGQSLSTHSAPFDAMVQILDGEAVITISGVDYDMKKGEMIIMPANEPHGLRATRKFKMMLTMVKG
jgi:quercetin dioxygenase-like cupin family protein